MALKDILLLLTDEADQTARLAVAAEIAQRDGGHLIGFYPAPTTSPFASGVPYSGSLTELREVGVIEAATREAARVAAERVENAFRNATERAGLSAEWRAVSGDVVAAATLHARYADITITGQNNPDHPSAGGMDLVETTLLGSGRPVLVVPYAGKFERIGRRALVAWNATREAARAINDALPLLVKAEKVTVLSVNPKHGIDGEGAWPAADIAHHLARHGVRAEASYTVAHDIDVGNVLLSRAADLDADLLVMGGYGHSRQREFILGGATRTILQHMTLPVLLSH